jgi:hypothetical protein
MPFWATSYLTKVFVTPFWAIYCNLQYFYCDKSHPKSHHCWAKLPPAELRCTLLSYTKPFSAILRPNELNTKPTELRRTIPRLSLHWKEKMPKIRNYNILRKGITWPQSQFPHSCVCERFIYSHLWTCLFCCRKYADLSLRIYKSLTDTWMWKWGLRPCNSQQGIHKWNFHCSVLRLTLLS